MVSTKSVAILQQLSKIKQGDEIPEMQIVVSSVGVFLSSIGRSEAQSLARDLLAKWSK
jgi:hypothetical protein